ncbi:BatD family protein [Shewanella sp. VB17]|uniref:BatD family protein n=1 Tax=Shewanella sp. VB17 TaxID=2739432 RepID=UPI001563F00A|nr:BatD family protein [Shewanella sp. VB17]NRD74587.1 BatD family protein [Shewanella sp. VB17]
MNRFVGGLLILLVSHLCHATPISPQLITTADTHHPVVGQQVVLSYELVVDGFFNGPTRFDLASLSGARLAKRSDFAVNGSIRKQGRSLATQRWEVSLYPEKTGLLDIPAMMFNIEYMNNEGKAVKQRLVSDDIQFFVYLPDELQGVNSYIVSPDVKVSDRWTGQKNQYEKGDVLVRQIQIEASDVQSIQIPRFIPLPVDGIKIIPQEAQLSDTNDRGQQRASMTQRLSYVITQAGNYRIGGESLYWWNLEQGEQLSVFPTEEINVNGLSPRSVYVLIIVVFLLLLLSLGGRYVANRPPSLKAKLTCALRSGDLKKFVSLLYQKTDAEQGSQRGCRQLKLTESKRVIADLFDFLYARPRSIQGSALSQGRIKEGNNQSTKKLTKELGQLIK